jgi:predicted nuclease of predicted toxin-antitoxin system
MSDSALLFLADESCDFAVVRALRAADYQVLAVSEATTRSNDSELMEIAAQEQLVLLTEDKDFGWLYFVSRKDSAGVILIRFPGNARETLAQTIVQIVSQHRDQLKSAFVVVQPDHIRISRKPEAE